MDTQVRRLQEFARLFEMAWEVWEDEDFKGGTIMQEYALDDILWTDMVVSYGALLKMGDIDQTLGNYVREDVASGIRQGLQDMADHLKEAVDVNTDPIQRIRFGDGDSFDRGEVTKGDMKAKEEVYGLNKFAKDARAISLANGFDSPASIDQTEATCTKLILIIDEVCEALYEVRKTGNLDAFGEELADVLIRTVDMTVDLGIDIDAIVTAKMAKNRQRAYRHGAKF